MEALGVVAGGHYECGRRVGTQAEEVQQLGNGGHEQCLDPLVELCELVVEPANPVRQRGQ